MTTTRERTAARRSWWADGLEAALWLVCAAGIALFVAAGGLTTSTPLDYLYSLGRMAGIVAAILVMNQVLLISRVPWIEHVLGHDRAAVIHTRMGKVAFILMLVHVGLILVMTAHYDGNSVLEQIPAFWEIGWFMPAAQVAFGLFTVVVATSLLIVRKRWRYETWHAVHIVVYVAIALVVPHQFIEGSTFRGMGLAWWFWMALYAITFGSWLAFRVLRPLILMRRHRLTVADVIDEPEGAVTIVLSGVGVGRLNARPGQFFLWRFLAPGMWREAHPYSLSRAARVNDLRITVRPAGDGSEALARVPVGTRVLAEGPLGVFSDAVRSRDGVVLIAAGIGITPIRSMLEHHTDGPMDVIVRASSPQAAPLLAEVRSLAVHKGAGLHEIYGGRGDGWTPASAPTSLSQLIPDLPERDVYICGPIAWTDAVVADALASGVAPAAIHRERFGWS